MIRLSGIPRVGSLISTKQSRMHRLVAVAALGMVLTLASGAAVAAPDWTQVPGRTVTVFYPGVSPIEWINDRARHRGAKGLRKGEPCTTCHDEETADMGLRMVTGQKNEPAPIAGKAGSIPVTVQAAYDAGNLYLRFSWQPPSGGAAKMDAENQVKLAVMLEDSKVDRAELSGCWETCHQDARTMPEARDDGRTKYVTGGDLDSGRFYDLIQWRSSGSKHDGYIADRRVMDGGKALIAASGTRKGGRRVVTFTRRLAGGGAGDIVMTAGRTYIIGFAIHDDHTRARFHHVSLGYTLGLGVDGDIRAVAQ